MVLTNSQSTAVRGRAPLVRRGDRPGSDLPSAQNIAEQGGRAAIRTRAEPYNRPGLRARRPASPPSHPRAPASGGGVWAGTGRTGPTRGHRGVASPIPSPPRAGRPTAAAEEGGRASLVQESGQPGALGRDRDTYHPPCSPVSPSCHPAAPADGVRTGAG